MSDSSNNGVQRQGERILAVLAALKAAPDGLLARHAIKAAEDSLELTEYELGAFESGGRRFDQLVRFNTVTAVKAGWMTKSAGLWEITDDGKDALAKHADPADLARAARRGYAKWKGAQSEEVEDDPPSDEELSQSVTLEEAEEDATAQIRRFLGEMDPYDLQELVGHLLRGMGYRVSWIAPPGKDGGIDLLAHTDPVGSDGKRIKVQVKREQAKTDVKGLRAFMSVLHPGDVGVFVTLGGFTSDAASEARNSETKRLTLIDFAELLRLWSEFYEQIQPEGQALLPLKYVPFLVLD